MDLEALALDIARKAHAGQTDKAGKPYIGHPVRIAASLSDPGDKVVALLHDVVEDTIDTDEPVTLEDLRTAGIPEDLVLDVDAITKRKGEAKIDYYRRVAARPRALRVKRADIADNTDPDRLALLTEAERNYCLDKYAKATSHLDRFEAEARAAS